MGCAPCVEATEGVERKCEPRTPTTTRGASKRRRKWRGSATRRSFARRRSDGGSGEEVRESPPGRSTRGASRRSDKGSGEEVRADHVVEDERAGQGSKRRRKWRG